MGVFEDVKSEKGLKKMIPAEQIAGEDADETALLQKMLKDATDYLRGFKWCPPIDQVCLGCGVGGVVAVFLFHFQERIDEMDEWLWVIAGDLPTMYLVLDQATNPASAIEVYCNLMEEWAKAVLEDRPLGDVFPVKAEASIENAKNLLKRINFIRTQLLPGWRANWSVNPKN